MAWFKRSKENISPDSIKSDVPDGQWIKCKNCNEIIHQKQLTDNFYVCPKCNYHFRVGSTEYIEILLDNNSFKEIDKKIK